MNRIIIVFLLAQVLPLAMWCQGGSSSENAFPNGWPADFPTPPKTEKSLFFIQRNKNKNTVVYDVNLKNGKPNSSKPIDVYWLRYAGKGERSELSWLQRTFAFGYNSKKDHHGDSYWITLTAYDGRKIHLEHTSDGKPIATMTINGKYCQLHNIWVYADESGTWPKVLHVDLHGKNLVTGKPEFERIYNK